MLEIFDDRVCTLGEGPYYDPRTGRVGWVDLPASRVLWQDVATGDRGEISTPEPVSAAVLRAGGGLVLCVAEGPVLADPDGTVQMLGTFAEADAAAGIATVGPAVRANDAKADPGGRLFVGTLALDNTPGAAALYRLDPGTAVPRRILGDVTVGNGLGWSPEGTTMYFADTGPGRVDAFDYSPETGEMTNRRTFVDFTAPADGSEPLGGKPDGLCMDAAGGLWVACWGGGQVLHFTADGALERRVSVPATDVTSCAFAGEDLDQLVITTAARDHPGGGAGKTYRYRPGDVTGLPVGTYGG